MFDDHLPTASRHMLGSLMISKNELTMSLMIPKNSLMIPKNYTPALHFCAGVPRRRRYRWPCRCGFASLNPALLGADVSGGSSRTIWHSLHVFLRTASACLHHGVRRTQCRLISGGSDGSDGYPVVARPGMGAVCLSADGGTPRQIPVIRVGGSVAICAGARLLLCVSHRAEHPRRG